MNLARRGIQGYMQWLRPPRINQPIEIAEMSDPIPSDSIPEGFKPVRHVTGFIEHAGPFYYRDDDNAERVYGFQTGAQHDNPGGVIHGGALFTFLDFAMSSIASIAHGGNIATVSLATEFMSGVAVGCFVEAHVTIQRQARSLAFLRGEVRHGDEILIAASGVWRLFPKSE